MVLLSLAAMVLQSAGRFEILEQGLPKGNVTVSCVSRSGRTALVSDGGSFWLVQKDEIVKVSGLRVQGVIAYGVRDDGMIAGFLNRQVIVHRDGFTRDISKEVGSFIILSPCGFGGDGLAHVTVAQAVKGGANYLHLAVADGDIVDLQASYNESSGFPELNRVVDQTQFGLLCEANLPIGKFRSPLQPTGQRLDGTYVGSFAAYLQGRTLTRFTVPPKSIGSRIVAWSDNGETVGGLATPSLIPIIWREGRIVETLTIKGQPINFTFAAFTKKGDMAVGCQIVQKPILALVWQEGKGVRSLADLATESKVEIPSDWKLIDALGITASGETITGNAKNLKDNRTRPFRLHLPPKAKKEEG